MAELGPTHQPVEVFPGTSTLKTIDQGYRRFLYNKDYSDKIWSQTCMNGTWAWNEGSLIDPRFMCNKMSFGRPPPQAPYILPARPNPKKEYVSLPFLAGGPRGTSSQKNRESTLRRANQSSWISNHGNYHEITAKEWAGSPTLRPREGARSNPPEVELYQERIKDLPHGFKRWKNSMHWGRVKSKREAIEALVGRKHLGPNARAMEKWQDDHSIIKRPPGAPHPRLYQRDRPLEHSFKHLHSSMDDPWTPMRFPGC